jgi:DNA polymerase III sliding clamp (beta) subunit (PCNA family)
VKELDKALNAAAKAAKRFERVRLEPAKEGGTVGGTVISTVNVSYPNVTIRVPSVPFEGPPTMVNIKELKDLVKGSESVRFMSTGRNELVTRMNVLGDEVVLELTSDDDVRGIAVPHDSDDRVHRVALITFPKLVEQLKWISGVAAKDAARPVLESVLVGERGMVASDGFRMRITHGVNPDDSGYVLGKEYILANARQFVQLLPPDAKDEITIFKFGPDSIFTFAAISSDNGDWIVYTDVLSDRTYPNIGPTLRDYKNPIASITVETDKFAAAIKRVERVAEPAVRFEALEEDQELKVSAKSDAGEISTIIPAIVAPDKFNAAKDDPIRIGLSIDYLNDLIKGMTSAKSAKSATTSTVMLQYFGTDKAAIFDGPEFGREIIMPMYVPW